MESRINKLANITGNGPQLPSETTWSLPIMILRNWKSVFFSFLESNKKNNAGLLKQMRRCPRNNSIFFFGLRLKGFKIQSGRSQNLLFSVSKGDHSKIRLSRNTVLRLCSLSDDI